MAGERTGDCDWRPFGKSASGLVGSTCLISLSIATTSFIIGRSPGLVLAQRNETASVWRISCIAGSVRPLSFASRMPAGSRFPARWSRTHWTKWAPPGRVGSNGCLPVRTSSSMTPKLYTSLFSVIFCVDACSVDSIEWKGSQTNVAIMFFIQE